jgi:ketosteroid isomerase-like protein
MAEHPNSTLLRKGYDAFAKADLETVTALIAEDAMWHVGGNNQLAGEYKGRDSILGDFFAKLITLSDGTFKTELHDVVANDTHAVAIENSSATRNGKTWEGNDVSVYHIRDGQLSEAWSMATDPVAYDAFWG